MSQHIRARVVVILEVESDGVGAAQLVTRIHNGIVHLGEVIRADVPNSIVEARIKSIAMNTRDDDEEGGDASAT